MANREDASPPEIHCVFVETSLETCLALLVPNDEIIAGFKEKLCMEHKQVFPEIGDVNISALKVKRRRQFYHLSDSMNVCKAFEGISKTWFMYVDAVRVEKGRMLAIMAADQNRSNLEKKKEIAVDDSVPEDGLHAKDLSREGGLETKVVEKKTRKRKLASSDGKTSRKKSKVDVVKIDQEKDLPLASELADGKITSKGEGSRSAPSVSFTIGHVDRVDATSESCPISRKGHLGKENEMDEKIDEDVASGKAIPSSATEKKKNQRIEKVSERVDRVQEKLADNRVEAIPNENEIGDKSLDKVGSKEATLIGADKIQEVNNLQVAASVSTLHALVHESKTNENVSREQEVSKEKVEIEADQAKSVKPTKKKSSKKAKTSAKEDTLAASGAQNVEPIKAVDGEGPDNVSKPGKKGKSKKSEKTLKRDGNVVEPMSHSGSEVKDP